MKTEPKVCEIVGCNVVISVYSTRCPEHVACDYVGCPKYKTGYMDYCNEHADLRGFIREMVRETLKDL